MMWAAMTPDERLRAVEAAIADRVSSVVLAQQLATTRNVLMGFAYRRGLRFNSDSPQNTACVKRGARTTRLRTARLRPIAKERADPAAAGPEALPLVKTRDLPRECRFPVGDWSVPVDDKLVCGRATVPGLSWCEGHLDVVAGKGTESERRADEGVGA